MKQPRNRLYLLHIQDAILAIESYIAGVDHSGFTSSLQLRDAVIRQLEIIGEATKRLSTDFRKAHPEVPWKDMAGMRDKLIHNYFEVDLEAVWNAGSRDVPELKTAIEKMLDEPPPPKPPAHVS